MTQGPAAPERARAFVAFAVLAAVACAHEGAPAASPEPSAGASSSSAATSAANAPAAAGGASVFVVHDVSDFDAFRKYLEEGANDRAQAGVKGYLLTRLDDGRIVIHFFAENVDQVNAALSSERMQSYLNRKGAPDASLVWLARDLLVKLPATPPTGKTYSLFFKLKTGDVAAFEQAFEKRSPVFAEQGVIAQGLHRSVAKDDVIFLHFMGTDREKLAALPKRPEFVELLALAGGADAAKPLLGEDVARSRPK